MKFRLLACLVCLHLLFVFARSFNAVVPGHLIITKPAANALLNLYTQYTVMQADYSFFSPNVGPSPFLKIIVEQNDSLIKFPLDIDKGELGIRLFTSLNAFNNFPEARELMARSWAAFALKKYNKADAITIEYYISNPRSVQDYFMGKQATDSLLYAAKYQVNAE